MLVQKKRSNNSLAKALGRERSSIGTRYRSFSLFHVLIGSGLDMLDSLNGNFAVSAFGSLGFFGNLSSDKLTSRSSDWFNTVGPSVVRLATYSCVTTVSHDDLINEI